MNEPMENICRTCLLYYAEQSDLKSKPNEVKKMMSIISIPEEFQEEKLSLQELLKTIMPQLKFMECDKLPQNVCNKCSEIILNFYSFQLKCLRNEDKLYKLLELGDFNELFNNGQNQIETIVKTELISNNESKNFLLEFPYEEILENDYCFDGNSNNSDILSTGNINESNCNTNSLRKEHTTKKMRKSLKKKSKQNSLKRRNKSIPPNTKELYSCDKCQRKLKSELSLIKHQELHLKKDNEEKELKCALCNQAFADIDIFKEHQRTHTSEKTFLCSECGKGFTSAGSLKQHSFRHLDKKLYPCSDCPKSFPTNGDLLCHYETHKAKPRIHVCDVCGRGFYKPFLLKQHQRYHKDERPFACEFCEKRFVTSEKQRRHMRTHTGEKPYPCKYCDRAFAQSNDCIKHLRQHLGDNVYQCELCPLRFPLARSLRAHFAGHKDDDEETRSLNLRARMEEEQHLQIKLSTQDL